MNNFDRQNIKLSVIDEPVYYFNKNNVVAKVLTEVVGPSAFHNHFGSIFLIGKGVAKCHPDDKYSIEKGKKIARARAESNAYKEAKKEILDRWNNLLDIIESLAPLKSEFLTKADKCNQHNDEYIDRITKEY